MKKLSLALKKYINRVSVLITVFSVLMTASFYNPASLASDAPLSFHDGRFSCQGHIISPNASDDISYASLTIPSISYGTSGSLDFRSFEVTVRYDMYWNYYNTHFNFDSEGNTVLNGEADLFIRSYLSPAVAGPNNTSQLTLSSVTAVGPTNSSVLSPIWTSNSSLIDGSYRGTDAMIGLVFVNYPLTQSNYYYFSLICTYVGSVFNVSSDEADLMTTFYGTPDFSLVTSTPGTVTGSVSDVTYGYNASKGNASQSKLDISMSEQESKEDSLFTSATGNLSKFSLTDLSAIPKVVAGLAFVSSTMTSVFEALGGVNGAGIVLSVGCSILFVSFCIGAYKFYSGRKD